MAFRLEDHTVDKNVELNDPRRHFLPLRPFIVFSERSVLIKSCNWISLSSKIEAFRFAFFERDVLRRISKRYYYASLTHFLRDPYPWDSSQNIIYKCQCELHELKNYANKTATFDYYSRFVESIDLPQQNLSHNEI